MEQRGLFSDDTKAYLSRFYFILDTMIDGMTEVELTNSISHNFIVQMIPHHMAAIEMSKNLLEYSECTPLRRIAENIITEQTQGIAEMEAALCGCAEVVNSEEDLVLHNRLLGNILNTMFTEMEYAEATNNINADFVREMIPHHEGAIFMARNALRFPICQALVPILENIIATQEKGVCEMEALLPKLTECSYK